MDDQKVAQFCTKYESLAGHAHHCPDEASALDTVVELCRQYQVERAAHAGFDEPMATALAEKLTEAGVEPYGPPFRSEDLPAGIDRAGVGITRADFAIAESGTLVEFATDDALRVVSTLPRVHIGVVRREELIGELKDAAQRIREFFAAHPRNAVVSFISGPSRTGDIEMRLTLGVHGPEIAHAIVVG